MKEILKHFKIQKVNTSDKYLYMESEKFTYRSGVKRFNSDIDFDDFKIWSLPKQCDRIQITNRSYMLRYAADNENKGYKSCVDVIRDIVYNNEEIVIFMPYQNLPVDKGAEIFIDEFDVYKISELVEYELSDSDVKRINELKQGQVEAKIITTLMRDNISAVCEKYGMTMSIDNKLFFDKLALNNFIHDMLTQTICKDLYELGIDVSVEYVKLDAFSNVIDLNKAKLVTKENIDE
jgi:hypothetical protein